MSISKYILTLCFVALCLCASAQKDYVQMQVKSQFSRGWMDERAKLVKLIPGFTAAQDGEDDFNNRGSYKYLKAEAKGYFYTKKIDGRWWLIDPDGYAAITMAVTSVPTKDTQKDFDICRRNGYNGIGNWPEDEEAVEKIYNAQNYYQFPYVRRVNFFGGYLWQRDKYYPVPEKMRKSRASYTVVLDPKFVQHCEQQAKEKIAPASKERNLVGWFIDNEIKFDQDQLRNLVRDLPQGDPSRKAALSWAATKGLSEEDCIKYTPKVTADIKEQFAGYLAETYYKIVTDIVRKYDPHHMILGSRLHGRPRSIKYVIEASHKYSDITSVNFYDRYAPDDLIAQDSWTQDKPCMVTEFYMKDINMADKEQSGAGWYVNNHEHRGYFYQNTCLELLRNKCYVGWHYFRYNDDPDGSNKGMLSVDGQEYTDMTRYMEELNKQVYRLCDFYDGKDRRPAKSTVEHVITAIEDTHIVASASDRQNFASAKELEIKYDEKRSTATQAFFKFDITSIKDILPNLKSAKLVLNATNSSDKEYALFISAIDNQSWKESTLTGKLSAANAQLATNYSRLSSLKGAVERGELIFNVTNYVAEMVAPTNVSFKLHDTSKIAEAVKIASKEYGNTKLSPKLILTFWDKPLK